MALRKVFVAAESVQGILSFSGSTSNPQFCGSAGGKMGTAGFLLGIVGGIHLGMLLMCAIMMYLHPLFQLDTEDDLLRIDKDMTNEIAAMQVIKGMVQWCVYVVFLCFFHFAEFFVTAVKQPKNLKYESFLLNHSINYTLANVVAWLEYFVEWWLWGDAKNNTFVALLGLCVLVTGQGVRSIGMWQCGENFAHEIMTSHDNEHRLITTGIYSYLRHPAYFGWFYWTIGTQILLCNPLCTVAYAYVSWKFFARRIPYEEDLLCRFYNDKYVDYCNKTPIGIPFIK